MLMRLMRRTLLVFVLVMAASIALEPVIHTHPLTQNALSQCAVCVNAHASVTTLTPVPISPLVMVGEVAVTPLPASPASILMTLASRAPPAA